MDPTDTTALAGLPRYVPNAAPEGVGSQELGKDAFLTLLTTQLRNQDPTSPVQNEDFVAQLAQFSSLEQLVGMQESLDAVYTGIAAMNNASMSSLLGKHVVAVGNTVEVRGDGATMHFEASDAYDGGTVTVFDENGSVVRTAEIPGGSAGEETWVWDGLDNSGMPVEDGTYTFSVSLAGDPPPESRELMIGRVDEMDYTSGIPQPSVNGTVVPLDAILRLTAGDE
jgi:flagellar basal-body rod modification protein FlgD